VIAGETEAPATMSTLATAVATLILHVRECIINACRPDLYGCRLDDNVSRGVQTIDQTVVITDFSPPPNSVPAHACSGRDNLYHFVQRHSIRRRCLCNRCRSRHDYRYCIIVFVVIIILIFIIVSAGFRHV